MPPEDMFQAKVGGHRHKKSLRQNRRLSRCFSVIAYFFSIPVMADEFLGLRSLRFGPIIIFIAVLCVAPSIGGRCIDTLTFGTPFFRKSLSTATIRPCFSDQPGW